MGNELIPLVLIVVVSIVGGLLLIDHLLPASTPTNQLRIAGRNLAYSILPILVLVLLLRSFVLEPFRIPSSSMEPTLVAGDYIVVNKFRYGLRIPLTHFFLFNIEDPRRGDIAVFFPSGDDRYFIKRVIGVPGDVISYKDKKLTINGRAVPFQPWLNKHQQLSRNSDLRGYKGGQEFFAKNWYVRQTHPRAPSIDFTVTVKEGHYFFMGDNRDNSRDSRVWGQVPRQRFVGPAVFRWMHWRGFSHWPNFSSWGAIH